MEIASGTPSTDSLTKPSAQITSLTFSDGTKLSFAENDIVVFVGPNNSGKSEALRNIRKKFSETNQVGLVVTGLEYKVVGDKGVLEIWLEGNFKKAVQDGYNWTYLGMGTSIGSGELNYRWNNSNGLGSLAAAFCCHLTAEERLNAANATPDIPRDHVPSHPLHYLKRKPAFEAKLNKLFKRAFNEGLILDRFGGSTLPLLVGEEPEVPSGKQAHDYEPFLTELAKLPTIQSQGDGMRSFTGVLLHSIVMGHSIVLIDEPEAFLHPPQARHLGKMIATEVISDRQFFFATHSGDFLRGLLDSGQQNIRMVRIERQDNVNFVKELKNEDIQRLWSDSLLRYSNILDGMFHEMVVLCESDSDCRFFAAVLDAIYDQCTDEKRPDIMFTHCGGKNRLKVGASALKAIGVKVAVIADLDALDDKTLENLCLALSGDWQSVSADWRTVVNAIKSKSPGISAVEAKKEIYKILEAFTDPLLPENVAEGIKKILKQTSPWSLIKDCGQGFIPPGGPTEAFDRLDSELKEIGIFLVGCGEAEGFDRTVSGHGPTWVSKVLEKGLRRAKGFSEAKSFIERILKWGKISANGKVKSSATQAPAGSPTGQKAV